MKWIATLAALATITSMYETPSKSVEDLVQQMADDSASSVRSDLESKINDQQRKIDDLEQRAVTRW